MLPIDTPAHVQHATHIQNGVHVHGGTNYDLSRGGVATPIVRLPDPLPVMPPAQVIAELPSQTAYSAVHGVPVGKPSVTLAFKRNSQLLSAEMTEVLSKLPKDRMVIVAGHADLQEADPAGVAKARTKAVSAYLKASRVAKAMSFGATLPLTRDTLNAEVNRRVEIFLAGPVEKTKGTVASKSKKKQGSR